MPVVHKNDEDDIEIVINMTNKNKQIVDERKKNIRQNQAKRKHKRNKRIKRLIRWTSIVVLLIAGCIFTLTSPLFNISEIQVENNNVLSKEKIVSLSGLTKDQNIFRFLKSDIETHIKEDAYVQDVEISRKLPGTVVINIEERNRDFSIKFLNGYAYINNQGYILEIAEDSLGLPIIQGIETPEEEIKVGNRLVDNDLKKLEVAIQIMTIAKENEINSKITSIDISNKNEYILYLEEEKKTVYLGNSSDLPTKMLYVKEIMEKYEVGKEGTIYVNGDFSKQFKAYFREKV